MSTGFACIFASRLVEYRHMWLDAVLIDENGKVFVDCSARGLRWKPLIAFDPFWRTAILERPRGYSSRLEQRPHASDNKGEARNP
jgi:hypothetical protein